MTHKELDLQNEELPLISFIVPVYGVEPYIHACVMSILEQDYGKIEVILVDDGSKDKSGAIIDEIAKKDHRVRVIHKENGGVSSARNVGLAQARGQYVAFVDGDDRIERDYASYFLSAAEKSGCDIVMGRNHFTVWDSKQTKNDHQKSITAAEAMEYIYLEKINVAVWNKLYRTDFLKKHQLTFNEQFWYGEGMLFNIQCLQHTDSILLTERKVYHQTYNPASAMRDFNLESNLCGLRSMEYQKKIRTEKHDRVEAAWVYHCRCYSFSILKGLLRSDTAHLHQDVYQACIRNLRKNISVPLRVDISLMRKMMYLAAAIAPVQVAKLAVWRHKRACCLAKECMPAAGSSDGV